MEIEKQLLVAAPPEQVWQLILDPNVMGMCVPGVQSTEVINDVEYVSHIVVKISFVSASFKVRTKIMEARAHEYLRTDGLGEDSGVTSSLRQTSELFLEARSGGRTQLRIRINVEVLGRLGAFGLSVLKTKADRMWDEFGENFGRAISQQRMDRAFEPVESEPADDSGPAGGTAVAPDVVVRQAVGSDVEDDVRELPSHTAVTRVAPRSHWLKRLFGGARRGAGGVAGANDGADRFCFEIRHDHLVVIVHWPMERMLESATWLREYMDRRPLP